MTVLVNRHVVVDHDGAPVAVGGIPDHSAARMRPDHRGDPAAALAGAPEDAFRLLLAHQPRSAYTAAPAGWQLMLCGHTHGGQIFPWSLVVRLAQPFFAGLHSHEGMAIYTSRGTGYWGPPMRVGADGEITLLTLQAV